MNFGFFNLGPTELIIILVIVLIIFGPKKLPDIGRSIGEMLSNFRNSTKNNDTNDEDDKPKNDNSNNKTG